jgi:hypothetical protein
MRKLAGIFLMLVMLAAFALPHGVSMAKETPTPRPGDWYFYFDGFHSTATGSEEIEIELYTNTNGPMTNTNLLSYSEIEWFRGSAVGDTQFFWGPDAYLVGGVEDTTYGPNPTGTGSLSLSGTAPVYHVTGTIQGNYAPNGDKVILIVGITYNSNTGAWSGAIVMVMQGTLYSGVGSGGNSDSGTWVAHGSATWVAALTPSNTASWSYAEVGVGFGGI